MPGGSCLVCGVYMESARAVVRRRVDVVEPCSHVAYTHTHFVFYTLE